MKKLIASLIVMAAFLGTPGIAVAEEPQPQQTEQVASEQAEPASASIEMEKHAQAMPAPPEEAPTWVNMLADLLGSFPDINGWLIAILMFLSFGLRGAAELLGFIAEKTETEKDNKAAAYMHKISLWASTLLGWFGGGKPKRGSKLRGKTA